MPKSYATTVGLLVALTVSLSVLCLVAGCGGDNGEGQPAQGGGTIAGQTRDAVSGLLIGGVEVAVRTPGGQWITAVSKTPNGEFRITGVPAGTYTALRVTPNPSVGLQQLIPVNIVVTEGGTVTIGTVLILDELPPARPNF